MSQFPTSTIQQDEIESVYNNRHAVIVRQTSGHSEADTHRIPSVSRSVSQDEDTLILERPSSRKDGNKQNKEFKLYSSARLNGEPENSFFPEVATPKDRWRILSGSGSGTVRSNPAPAPAAGDVQLDDVFVEEPGRCYSIAGDAVHSPVCSTSSTASVIHQNPYNVWNHKVHDTMWCSCCMYFFLLCCIPAVVFMEKSDSAHKVMDEKKAIKYGNFSTKLFILGGITALLIYALLFFVVVYVSTVVF